MPTLMYTVQRKMSITAHRKVRNILEGEYSSVFKGRSMDFDDLREYIPGDDIKDIEWRATARSGSVRIKRYVAIRKHNILLVVDTGRSMAATAPSGEPKRDIAVMAAGVIASIALQHNDLVGLTVGNSQFVDHLPLKGSYSHAERILQKIHKNTNLDSPPSDINQLLDHVRKTIKKRMILVIISDNVHFSNIEIQLLKRLGAQHEILFIAIDDLSPSDKKWINYELREVAVPTLIPQFIRQKNSIEQLYAQHLKDKWEETDKILKRNRIGSIRIASESKVINKIIYLLEAHKHARH